MDAGHLDQLFDAARNQDPVSGLTHGFYRYPARFSPQFARTAIQLFSKPGDTVLDPFMGGATVLVEAKAFGRHAVGTDISSLAVFLARAKTGLLSKAEMRRVVQWARKAAGLISPIAEVQRQQKWIDSGYQKDVPWRLRKMIEQGISSLETLASKERRFARCALLRSSQWALDCRDQPPTAQAFRDRVTEVVADMQRGMQQLLKSAAPFERTSTKVAHAPARELPSLRHKLLTKRRVKLVVTSPPYPGVHVLYHRWQVRGRRETAAPFWIADCQDGQGASHYTFGDRKRPHVYFDHLAESFSGIRQVLADDAIVVQLVGFADVETQLPQYLKVMQVTGFEQVDMRNSNDLGTPWRTVPNRKWYAKYRSIVGPAKEIVLIHRPTVAAVKRRPASI